VWRGATAHQIRRYFFEVDLASIPADATITKTILKATGHDVNICSVSVQRGSQADIITTADYDSIEGWRPGDDWPDGITVETDAVFPEGWRPGDELPNGVIVDEGAEFPEGWVPGDEWPDGITVETDAVFPEGWRPGDELPEGVIIGEGAEWPENIKFADIDWTPNTNYFSFNPIGIEYMQKKIGSIAKVCLREHDHDYLDIQPSEGENILCGFSGTPQFTITYTD
jgi:hypothetical protein